MTSIERAVGVLLVGAMLSVSSARGAGAGGPDQPEAHALLDVPYVSQTPELCGGAAVAMVLRYWGERGVFPQDFASLVSGGDGGIFTGALASAVRNRGWQALVVPEAGDAARTRVRWEIHRGRPLIALIEVGPATYHYVVIVGSTDQDVVLHDPARSPFRVLHWSDFDRAWAAAGRWTMLVLPSEAEPSASSGSTRALSSVESLRSGPGDSEAAEVVQTPCGALVERGVTLALAGDRQGADQVLVAANGFCPNDPAAWRELAGLRFSQSRWPEAQDLALAAVRLDPNDSYAWQLVASSRYLQGDMMGALDAWNRGSEPRIDTIDIQGTGRTRQPVVVRRAGLQPREVLTSERFGRALRRLRELPVASNARLKYEPVLTNPGEDGGLAKVDVAIDERRVGPSGWSALGTLGVRALLFNELRVDVAGPLGAGELVSASWRWSANRPRVVVGLALPSPGWLPGLVSIYGLWERQAYYKAPSSVDAALVREERRRVGLSFTDWSTSWLRWQTGAALDRFRDAGTLDGSPFEARDYFALESTLDVRLASDRVALAVSGGWWAPLTGADQLATGRLQAAWRSTADVTRPSWSAVTDVGLASDGAPLALWQGVGSGQGRNGLLRAHTLFKGGTLTGPMFGRGLAGSSLEYARPVRHIPRGSLSIAGFVDAARAWQRLNDRGASRIYVDAGVGVRLHGAGPADAIRIDIAHGLRGGGTMLSASWGTPWPR